MADYRELFPHGDPALLAPDRPINTSALPELSPGQMGGRVRRAIPVGLGGALDPTDLDKQAADLFADMPIPQSRTGVSLKDYGRAFLGGAGQLAASAAAGGEYLQRQMGNTNEANAAAEHRRMFEGYANEQTQLMSPEARDRMARQWTTLDPNKTIWQGGAHEFVSSLLLQATQSAPSSLVTLLPGALMLRAGLSGKAISYLGASEGVLSAGSIAQNVADEIEQAPEAELMQSERYQTLRSQLDEKAARSQLITEAQGAAPAIGGFVTGLIGAATGKYLQPVLEEGATGVAGRFVRGAAGEAVNESLQSGQEQIAQNIAAQTYDKTRSALEGAGEAAVQGGAVGGLTGGVTTAAVGRRHAIPVPPTLNPEPTEAPPAPPVPPDIAAALQASETAARQEADLANQPYVDPATGQGEMFGRPPTEDIGQGLPPRQGISPQDEYNAYQQKPWPVVQGELDVTREQYDPSRDYPSVMVNEPQQRPLGLREPVRRRGIAPEVIVPTLQAAPEQADMSAPDQFAGAAPGTFKDENQLDLFAQPEATPAAAAPQTRTVKVKGLPQPTGRWAAITTDRDGNEIDRYTSEDPEKVNRYAQLLSEESKGGDHVTQVVRLKQTPTIEKTLPIAAGKPQLNPDTPSAEPVADLVAQLQEMQSPESGRKAVYLSRANIANLRQSGFQDAVRNGGVPLANFDGKGGTLIAKDRAAAEELIALRDKGAGNKQEILGYATGAGTGKTPGANIVVQRRNAQGAVTQESLVATPEEANALAAKWGPSAVVLTAQEALQRRNEIIQRENTDAAKKAQGKKSTRKLRDAIEQNVDEDTAHYLKTVSGNVSSDQEAAQRTAEAAQLIEGIDRTAEADRGVPSPNVLHFSNPADADTYRGMYVKDVPVEKMRAFLRLHKPETTSQRIAKAAIKIDKKAATSVPEMRKQSDHYTAGYATGGSSVTPFSRAEVSKLTGPDLDTAFLEAAEFMGSGKLKFQKKEGEAASDTERNPEDYIKAYGANESSKRKLINRAQRKAQVRRAGGKLKSAPVTASATVREKTKVTKGGTVVTVRSRRSGGIDTNVLMSEVEGAREPSAKDDKSARAKDAEARKALGRGLEKAKKLLKAFDEALPEAIERKVGTLRAAKAHNYLKVLVQLGEAQIQIKGYGNKVTEAISKNAKLLDASEMTPQYLHKLSRLFDAEMQEQAIDVVRGSGGSLRALLTPENRRKTALTSNAVKAAMERDLKRLSVLKRFSWYTQSVEPLMKRYADFVTGTAQTFAPTEQELLDLNLALKQLPDQKELQFITDAFAGMGYTIADGQVQIERDAKGNYSPTPPKVLDIRWRHRFGSDREVPHVVAMPTAPQRSETPLPIEKQKVDTALQDRATAASEAIDTKQRELRELYGAYPEGKMPKAQQARAKVLRDEIAQAFRTLREWIQVGPQSLATNRAVVKASHHVVVQQAIDALRAVADRANVSFNELNNAEHAFFETLRAAGLASPVGKSGLLWHINMGGKQVTLRPVMPQVLGGKETIEGARDRLQQVYTKLALPNDIAASRSANTRAATLYQNAVNKYRSYKKSSGVAYDDRGRRRELSPEQRKALEALERRKAQYNANLIVSMSGGVDAYQKAGRALGNLLENEGVQLKEALQTIISNTQGFTRDTAQRVLDVLPNDIPVEYGETVNDGVATLFWERNGDAKIVLNRDWFSELRDKGTDPAPALLHALLHEAVHAVTITKLKNDTNLYNRMGELRDEMLTAFKAGRFKGTSTYFLRDAPGDLREFVAEMYSNPQVQAAARQVLNRNSRTLWGRFIALVRQIVGLPEKSSVFAALVEARDELFTGERLTPSVPDSANLERDEVGATVSGTIHKLMQSVGVEKDLRNHVAAARSEGSSWLLPAMTMEQIRDRYWSKLPHLSDYMTAFFAREADNTANKEPGAKLSTDWVKLTEAQGVEAALNASRLMTDATVWGVHPDLPIQHHMNAHATGQEVLAKHAELRKQYDAMSPEWKAQYQAVKKYYANTLKTRADLVLLNVLRGYITTKSGSMSAEEFSRKYTEDKVDALKLGTAAGIEAEFGRFLDAEEISEALRLSALSEVKGPYFPLSRNGDYVVSARKTIEDKAFTNAEDADKYAAEVRERDPTLEVKRPSPTSVQVNEVEVRLAETHAESLQRRAELVEKYGDAAVSNPDLKSNRFKGEAAITGDAGLTAILKKLDGNAAAQAAVKEFYLRQLADKSLRKRELRRKKTRGMDAEAQHRALNSYVKADSYFTSQLRYGWKMSQAKYAMDQYIRDEHKDESEISTIHLRKVLEEIQKRDTMTVDPGSMSKLVRGGTALGHFLLLTSPSYWMINSTQPYMVSLPFLAARHGMANTIAAMGAAQKLIFSPLLTQSVNSVAGLRALWNKTVAEDAFSVLDQVKAEISRKLVNDPARAKRYLSMLEELRRDNVIDFTLNAELRDIVEGKTATIANRVLDASQVMSHLTEVNNRIITAIAAYDLGRLSPNSDEATTHRNAVKLAKAAVSRTQFNYSTGNKPRLFQAKGPAGQFGPLVFQFMQYTQHMYALMITEFARATKGKSPLERAEARRTLGGIFATHLAAGGMLGVSLQPIKWAVGLALMAFGGDDDTPETAMSGEAFDRLIREGAADVFGTEMGRMISKGAPAALGVDLSNRMSLGSLYFMNLDTKNAESLWGSLLLSMGGPLPGIASNWGKGISQLSSANQGMDYSRALENFMPKGIKDIMQFARFEQEGLRDNAGNTIIAANKMTAGELFMKSLGFGSTRVSEAYDQREAITAGHRNALDRKQSIIDSFRKASTPEARASVVAQAMEFSKTHPLERITYADLLRKEQIGRQIDQRYARFGANVRNKERALVPLGTPYEMDDGETLDDLEE